LLDLYAGWGVDYIKADDIARPVHRDEIAALHRAITKTSRNIVLSLSPGPATLKDLTFLQENANMWRISDDFWNDWQSRKQMFLLLSVWGGVGRPGAWPDADMLPLGSGNSSQPLRDCPVTPRQNFETAVSVAALLFATDPAWVRSGNIGDHKQDLG
jgi:hypothetical protein